MRIGSLLEGSIGRQLFTKKSIPIEELVKGNTILVIRAIESTAQKMSTLALLTLIFDYFKSLGPTSNEKTRCLLILDEAESIFAAAEAFGNYVELVTPAFKAVQKLNQILRQGRAFVLAVVAFFLVVLLVVFFFVALDAGLVTFFFVGVLDLGIVSSGAKPFDRRDLIESRNVRDSRPCSSVLTR